MIFTGRFDLIFSPNYRSDVIHSLPILARFDIDKNVNDCLDDLPGVRCKFTASLSAALQFFHTILRRNSCT